MHTNLGSQQLQWELQGYKIMEGGGETGVWRSDKTTYYTR